MYISDLNDISKRAILDIELESYVMDMVVKELSLEIDEKEISTQAGMFAENDGLTDEEIYETIKSSLVKQKAIEHFASEIEVSGDSAREYIKNHPDKYPEQPGYEIVKQDITMEMGERRYEELVQKIKDNVEVAFAK